MTTLMDTTPRTWFLGLACLALTAASSTAATQNPPPGYLSLHSWWSHARGDNYATTHPHWRGSRGQSQVGYYWSRVEGYVFDPTLPQPTGTIALHAWWHAGREDNFATTRPGWRGSAGQVKEGYGWAGIEGYIFDPTLPQPAGTVALHSWWHPGREDNFATTQSIWRGSAGQVREGYYWSRIEGYVYEVDNYTPFSRGCGVAGGPILEGMLGTRPRAGGSYPVTIRNLRWGQPSGSVLLLYGLSRYPSPLALGGLGMPGCLLHLAGPFQLQCSAAPLGLASCDVPMPNIPGLTFYNQAVVLDARANALGVALSNPAVGVTR